LESGDAPAIQEHFPHWNIIKNLSSGVPWPYPEDRAIKHITEVCLPGMEKGTVMAWAICERDNPEQLIGVMDYFPNDRGDLGNRGFWLAIPYQGRGYMTEATHAVQDYLFIELGIAQLILANSVDNKASSMIKRKSGATLLRIASNSQHHSGITESEIWRLTREDWERFRKGEG